MKQITSKKKEAQDLMLAKIERALIRAGEQARKTARFYETSIHIMKDGKIIAVKP